MITSQGPADRKRISALLLLFLLSLLFVSPVPACMILVPGSIISLLYYWSGSWLSGDEKVPVTIHIVRGGTLLRTLNGETPLEFELLDEGAPAGQMTTYRLVDSMKQLTSNPIFVRRQN